MLEILDIGNSFTRIAEWDGKKIRSVRKVSTADFCGTKQSDRKKVAACVCPEVKKRLQQSGIEFISALNQRSQVDFSGVDRSTLGADRVANAVALADLHELPGVVIDCGTALTMEIVDDKKRFAGGAIAPGRKLQRHALFAGTAQLPDIPLQNNIPENPGCNTVDAITFGIDAGAVGVIKEWLDLLQKKMDIKTIVFTGGDAEFFAQAFPQAIVAGEEFTLHGIRIASGN